MHEPTYTLDGYLLAGWHHEELPDGYTLSEPGTDKGLSRSSQVVTLVANEDARLAASELDALARAEHLALESDGTMARFPSLPDPWSARQHESVPRRSASGRTTFKRTRVGMATVNGRTDRPAGRVPYDGLTDDACNARIIAGRLLEGCRHMVTGVNSLDVQRVTDLVYGRYLGELDALVGTDVTAYEQGLNIDQVLDVLGTSRTSGISGPYRDSTWDRFAAPTAVYAGNTGSQVEWPMRVTLPIGHHRRDDARDSHVFVVASDGTVTLTHSLIGPSWQTGDDGEPSHRFHGHTRVRRPDAARDRRAESERTDGRTIGTVREPTNRAGWTELLDHLNRGERIAVTTADGRGIVTRSPSGMFATSGALGRHRSRTVAKLVDRLTA